MTAATPGSARGEKPQGRLTALGYPLASQLMILVGVPALAILVGALLPPIARWVLGLSPGLPLRPVFAALGAVNRPLEIVINLALWLLAGLGAASAEMARSARVTLTDAQIHLTIHHRVRSIARDQVDAVFLDGGKLVVLDRESRQLVRENHQAPGRALASAFRDHAYPWHDRDPHAAMYRRWVPGTPELPPSVNSLLAARESLLEKNKNRAGQEATRLREAAEALGFVIRDEGTRQYWRALVR